MGRFLEILRDLKWEAPLLECKVGRVRDIHRDSHLVYMVEMREALSRALKKVMAIEKLRDIHGYLTRFQW